MWVQQVDSLLKLARHHPAKGNRAEFVRLAITEKLVRDMPITPQNRPETGDLMIFRRLNARVRAGSLPTPEFFRRRPSRSRVSGSASTHQRGQPAESARHIEIVTLKNAG